MYFGEEHRTVSETEALSDNLMILNQKQKPLENKTLDYNW